MQDFICNNCWIKVDGQFYDDTNIIDYLYYCDDCYNQKSDPVNAFIS